MRYLGASSTRAWQFAKALFTADFNGWTRFVSMQDHDNLLHREEEREMLLLCADQGIVLPWSPLARGRLARGRLARPWQVATGRTDTDEFGKDLYAEAASEREIGSRVQRIAEQCGVPMAQVALAWVLHQDVVTAPIVGARRSAHLEDAVAALDLALSVDDLKSLEEPYQPHGVARFT